MVIVIPCYKESKRLPAFLPGLGEATKEIGCKIQVVDDGSPQDEVDQVRKLVDEVRAVLPHVMPLLALPVNVGKGGAIRAGWLAHANEDQLAFVDADGAVAPAEVARFLKLSRANPNRAFFASRVKMLGRNIHRSPVRHYAGRIFATIVSLKLKVPVYDSQCGLKVIPAHAFHPHADRYQETGFALDPEMLLILLRLGVEVEEVPVDWTHVEGSKVRLFRHSVTMFRALNRIVERDSKWTLSKKTR